MSIIGAGDLASFDTMVREILGASVDLLSWPTEVVESGLQLALADYEAAAPAVEVRVSGDVRAGDAEPEHDPVPAQGGGDRLAVGGGRADDLRVSGAVAPVRDHVRWRGGALPGCGAGGR